MSRLSVVLLAAMQGVLLSAPAFAATRHVTLAVPGMTCPTCPATLRVVLDRLPGVDSRVTDRDLTEATKNAGYPSNVVKNK